MVGRMSEAIDPRRGISVCPATGGATTHNKHAAGSGPLPSSLRERDPRGWGLVLQIAEQGPAPPSRRPFFLGCRLPARRFLRLSPRLLSGLCLAALTGPGCHAVPGAGRAVPQAAESPAPERLLDPDRAPNLEPGANAAHAAGIVRGQSDDGKDANSNASDEDGPPARRRRGGGGRGFFGIPPLRELVDDSTDDDDGDGDGENNGGSSRSDLPGSPYFPEARDDPVEPDICKPGPDTANFPNSPYTLPQGRVYVETSPVFLSGPSRGTPKSYNAEFLLRFGLTDRVELRLFSNGVTVEKQKGQPKTGMAPLAWDLKTMFWKENEKAHIPAVGLEVFLLTPSGSRHLNQGTQPSINLLFDMTLPWDFLLEWNVGVVGDPSPNNQFSSIEPAAAWALQHEIVEGFDLFFHGYFNGPTLPRFGDGVELGGGAVWAPNTRISFFGSYNAGVSQAAPNTIVQIGGAVAF